MKKIILLTAIALFTIFCPIQTVAENDLHIACEGGAILIDYKTSRVMYEQDADKHWPPASITKLMTAIIALENGDLRDDVLFSENATIQDGTKLGVKKGMAVPLYLLVEAMLVRSGNDGAVAIAEHIAGSEKNFAVLMNQKAESLGMKNTNFANASGLPDDNQYSTARDISKLAVYAIGREDIRRIVSKHEVDFINPDGTENIVLPSTNKLLDRHPLVDGIKTGYTIKSKYCLAASACFRDCRLIAIVLGSEKKYIWDETARLLDWGFAQYDPLYSIYWEFEKTTDIGSNETSTGE